MSCLEKAQRGQARLRQLGINISDAITADFAKVAYHESRCQHFDSKGKVKGSFQTKAGVAIGYSQILPTTAKATNPRLNVYDETDNIALGLQYFNSLGSDPIIRRLAYVGGAGSWTIREYKKTGKVPTARMYPSTSLKETYYDYVKSTGGFGNTATQPSPSAPLSSPPNPVSSSPSTGQGSDSGYFGVSLLVLGLMAGAGILFAVVLSED